MPASGFPNLAPIPSPSSGIAPLDPSNQMATFLAMQTMGFPLPGIPTFPQPTSPLGQPESPVPGYQPTNKKTQRCRDYDTKGFCARGNACMYEHGTESIYMPPNIVEGMILLFKSNADFIIHTP
jgi:RNA-binding protein 26